MYFSDLCVILFMKKSSFGLQKGEVLMQLVLDFAPSTGNGRNSEGSFIRLPDGAILFAYSRYNTNAYGDNADCDIAAVYSYDEGESWSQPKIIAYAAQFGVGNIMSVSCIQQLDGKIGVYFLIKENEGNIRFKVIVEDNQVINASETFVSLNCTYEAINTVSKLTNLFNRGGVGRITSNLTLTSDLTVNNDVYMFYFIFINI